MGALQRHAQRVVNALTAAEEPAEQTRLRGLRWADPAQAKLEQAEAALRSAQAVARTERGTR
eukprot:5454377-Lingulodinium_polyedra.AAC.1